MTTAQLSERERAVGPARLTELDPVALYRNGLRSLVLTEPVVLGADDEFDVRFLRLLREAMSVILRIDWTAGSALPFDPALVCHLPPPRPGPQDGVGEWRRRHRYGLCYYRTGPGFLLLRDVRAEGMRYRLDDERAVACWPRLEAVAHLPGAEPDTRTLCDLLDAERLVVRRGAWATLLPYRMRQWPVPFDAV
ncbi:MAG TPA: DUF5825 family protein [Actinophytocola sp.]|uniref:DUF5825 family protein n=1 Tax=Actinophytocola sp. TaxID=1872138 RepID=UPI002DB6030C|nr:DUF5825 family protein [Actinophytocola sp.]HEU5471033.1 DUF5825 family protein [Actinophytocola sp.]